VKRLSLFLSTVISQFPFRDEGKRNGDPVHAMKAWDEVEVQLHSFLNSEVESSNLSVLAPIALIPGQNSAGTL
jgi:hypothetical protein